MSWSVDFLPEAQDDLEKLDGSIRSQVKKALEKVSQNPLPKNEGGYGNPLGSHASGRLAGLMKIKLRRAGIRIVYQIERTEQAMTIVIIGIRAENEVYKEALRRRKDNNL